MVVVAGGGERVDLLLLHVKLPSHVVALRGNDSELHQAPRKIKEVVTKSLAD